MPSLSIVIPCRNEAEAVPAVLDSLEQALERQAPHDWEVIVVDDCSTDETPSILKNYPWLKVLKLSEHSGYGTALKAGFQAAKGSWIAFFDMDGTYDPKDLETLFRATREGSGSSLVFGERFTLGQGMPAVRSIGNRAFSWLVRRLYRHPVSDACTGFRVFSRAHLQEIIRLPHGGLDFSLAFTLWAIRSKTAFVEVPVRYHARSGRSKLNVITDGLRFFWLILTNHLAIGRAS